MTWSPNFPFWPVFSFLNLHRKRLIVMMQYVKEFASQRLILFLLFVFVFSGCMVAATSGSKQTLAAMLTGVAFYVVAEYIIHRYILHEFPRMVPGAYRAHAAHHQHPNDAKYLFGPVSADVSGYLLLLTVSYFVTDADWHLMFSFVFGTCAFQIYYQWMHYIAHRPVTPLTPWGKWMKKKHLLHHHLDERSWYGVSNPMLDVLMGTSHFKMLRSRAAREYDKQA